MNVTTMKHPRSPLNQRIRKKLSGFTMIETLIAGLIVGAVMTAVGRLGISSMTASRNQSNRTSIEAAINDHIQLIQMQDSYLTAAAIEAESGLNTTLEKACENPSTFLMNHLKKPEIAGNEPIPEVSMEWNSSNPYLLKLTYLFEGPESSIELEQRIVEVNPNFSSQCYDFS